MAVSIDPDSKILGVLDFLYNTLVKPQEYQTPVFDTGQTQQFADTHNAMLPERGSRQSMLLPFGYDAQGNIELAIPSLARDVGLGAFGLLGEYEKAQTGTGYGSLDDITPQEAANSMQGLLEVMTGGLIDNAPKSVRSGLSRGGDNIVTGAERDANFKNWFGNSKVVDEAGEPLTVYHGSADDIEAFNLGHPNRKDTGWLGEGVYTTDNAGTASTYSIMKAGTENPNVMPLNLSLKNPYYATIEEKHAISKGGKAGAKEFTEKLKEMGHDGVILKYGGDDAPNIGNREFVVFEPTQVKSIHNSGTYDPKDANILKGIAPIAGAGLLGAGMMRQEEQQPQQGILN